MQFTPSSKSSFVAGMGLSLVGWLTLSHIDSLAELFRLRRWVDCNRIFNWIAKNPVLALLFTEFANYGIHGIENPNAVTFAGGATIINAFIIVIVALTKKLNPKAWGV